ncbi:MAG: hypothetical protein IPM59_06380 [Chloracidobacterium sp.]|nr:hypothetical protein [Chloracidobacterium sp.]
MLKVVCISVVAFLALLSSAIPSLADISVMPVSEIREGMRGTAKSVFRGSQPEEFSVEILGVLPNWIGPGQDMIVGKLSGANAERTFVFAGMSGSPVYINGKLVGAISYSFPFAKEPICGITPFEQMRSLVEAAPQTIGQARQPVSFSLADLATDRATPDVGGLSSQGTAANVFDAALSSVAVQSFVRIATPVTFSGISQRALDLIAPEFERAGFVPIAAAGGDGRMSGLKKADATTLLAGDSVVVHLSRGDIQIAAAGTVTHRDGNKIYAFGHPFFSLGSADLPMSESHVVTVVPNTNNSFKLAVSDALVGSMTQDRATGIYGMLGREPQMMPVTIRINTSRGRKETVRFETAVDDLLTGLILNAGIANTLIGNERGIGESTIEVGGEIRIRGGAPLRLSRRFVGPQATGLTAAAVSVPVTALLRAGFDGLQITGVDVDLSVTEGSRTAVIDRLSVDRNRVRAGESVEVTLNQRSANGEIVTRKIPVTVPEAAMPGPLSITVADGGAAQQASAVTHFTPLSTAEFVSTFNRLKRSDRLYLMMSRPSVGAVIGVSEMPGLPPSVLATINSQRSAGMVKPTTNAVLAEFELPPSDLVVTGSQSLTIEVVR